MPNAELLSRAYLGAVYDAMHLLGYRAEQFYINIKPIAGYSRMVIGPAFTTSGRVVGHEEDYTALDNIRLKMYQKKLFINQPVVILEANDRYCAHSGDITSQIYKSLGAVGFVTEGNVRDIDRINALAFPTFANGSNPIDALDYWALDRYGIDVDLSGVKIRMGDMIFASADGVIRVPQEEMEAFEQRLVQVLRKENLARETIDMIIHADDAGLSTSDDFYKLVKDIGRW